MKNLLNFENWKTLWTAFKPYKKEIVILAFFGFFGGLFESLGVNILIPLFSFITKNSVGDDKITQFIKYCFQFLHIEIDFFALLVFISILFILKSILQFFSTYISIRISSDFELETRERILRKTVEAPWAFLLQQKIGFLETTIMTDVKYAGILLQSLSGLVITLSGLFVYIFVALTISFKITFGIVFVGCIALYFMRPLLLRVKNLVKRTVSLNKDSAHYINQQIVGMKTIKVMNASESFFQKSHKIFQNLRDIRIKISLLAHISNGFIQPLAIIIICVLFGLTYKQPNFNFASLIAIVYLIQRVFLYVNQLQNTFQRVNESIPYLEAYIDYEKKVPDSELQGIGNKEFIFENFLEFRNVSFSYTNGIPLLEDINFTLKKGSMLGIVGPSGAGKTTLVDILLRLFNPGNGKIFVDGSDIQEISIEEWRKNIGYVSQDIFLINDTILNNITFYSNEFSKEDIIQAAKDSAIYEFIQTLEKGFETTIGDRGVLLSAGQRQRIIIARILLRKPKLLLLDEATSSLDNESEAKIQNVIENLKGKVTVLVIAHRLSTVKNCQKLIVMEKGKIIEQGSPEELLSNKNSYFYKVSNL